MVNQNNQTETLYELYDLQDDDECLYVMTLNGIKNWLVNLWNDNPDKDMTNILK